MKTIPFDSTLIADPSSLLHVLSAPDTLAEAGLPSSLLTTSKKTEQGGRVGVMTRILYLTPGVFCPFASDACRKACLGHSSGRMRLPSSAMARDKRTAAYRAEPEYFLAKLRAELAELVIDARRMDVVPAVRLNGTSDLAWERLHGELFRDHGPIQFYDYTKSSKRMEQFLRRDRWPANYHLTFSADATTDPDGARCRKLLAVGGNVALPFASELPETWWGVRVLDGDLHDARFLDPAGHIVGLRAKGAAKQEGNAFVFRHKATT